MKNTELVCICNSCSIVLGLRQFRDLVKRLLHFENALSISHDAGVFNAIAATRFNIGNLVPNFWKYSEGRSDIKGFWVKTVKCPGIGLPLKIFKTKQIVQSSQGILAKTAQFSQKIAQFWGKSVLKINIFHCRRLLCSQKIEKNCTGHEIRCLRSPCNVF